MLQRPTQTAAFWRDHFEVTADDTEFLYQLLLDAQQPIKLSALALALIDEYLRRENSRIEQDLSAVAGALVAEPDDVIRDRCEQTIRNYDPCISCSAHFLNLSVHRS